MVVVAIAGLKWVFAVRLPTGFVACCKPRDKAAKVDIELGMKDMLWCELGMDSCTCGSDANVEISGKSGVGRYGNSGMHYTTLSIHFDVLGSLC